MPVGLPWEKCLPGINWVISITLKCQARLGEEPLSQSTSHPGLATERRGKMENPTAQFWGGARSSLISAGTAAALARRF